MTIAKDQLQTLLDASGFPFQSAVTEAIRSTGDQDKYWVCLSEHPWRDDSSEESGFIDLVIEKGSVRIIIECKRAKGGIWVFTVPVDNQPNVETARLPWQGANPNPLKHGVGEFRLSPPTYESRECIIRGQDDDNRTLLERLGSKLLRSIDALMKESWQTGSSSVPETYVHIPCIVTTAQLVVAKIDPHKVSLNDGAVSDFDYEIVNLVKFRKSLVTTLSAGASPNDLGESNRDKERTLLIVNSSDLVSTLNQVAINLLRRKSPQLWST